eukprot:5643402-Prymnesium_polylepis.2
MYGYMDVLLPGMQHSIPSSLVVSLRLQTPKPRRRPGVRIPAGLFLAVLSVLQVGSSQWWRPQLKAAGGA